MFLQLAHTKLESFKVSQELAMECYKIEQLKSLGDNIIKHSKY
jgi:hypothetical protein